ncbi:ABC transporter ATP-binding protein [Spiribacter vilamensis]|uniref:Carbohydrate ABC transporter ATP-binding protein (CUT1 family) n=1 Tax=Spiribacter vilamensis TaxID=531306 RepID=A0A4Q8D2T9_9GAMM|nr:ABC transporter ATP-binding protein [Spiribacter vilamensis]RZU99664.1 carbohydrate ABC transporter ATP-binding protein (CUT1 family) [Spiribacter vilamensis]TVO61382.1 ABC transporter ATP-binding protein [Spiribacter vilamensis]
MSLVLEGVNRTVGNEAHLQDVNLTFQRGEFNVLLGLTEAGKTTMMRIMAGLDRPNTGRVMEDGQNMTRVPVRKRSVGMVYQQFINYPSLTVYDNIASPLKLAKLSDQEIERRVRTEAERLGIDHLIDRLPSELSGGQQQRCAMARALVRDAKLVLLDEPLVNLDYKLREGLRSELRNLFADRDTVVVYATTEPEEALVLGGKTTVLHEGRIIQHGPTAQCYRHPATTTVTQVFADPPMNLMPVRIDDGRIKVEGLFDQPLPVHMTDLAPAEYTMGIRPHHLFVTPADDRVVIHGTVEVAEVAGSVTYIHLEVNGHDWVVDERGVHTVHPGESFDIHADLNRAYVFDSADQLVAAPKQ